MSQEISVRIERDDLKVLLMLCRSNIAALFKAVIRGEQAEDVALCAAYSCARVMVQIDTALQHDSGFQSP